jgi:hypothetical protein
LKEQADGVMSIDELRELLEQERMWLQEAQRTLTQVRELRANERGAFGRALLPAGLWRLRLHWHRRSQSVPATLG